MLRASGFVRTAAIVLSGASVRLAAKEAPRPPMEITLAAAGGKMSATIP